MSMHLYRTEGSVRLLVAYEDGSVVLWSSSRPKSVEGQGWSALWISKQHVESSKPAARCTGRRC